MKQFMYIITSYDVFCVRGNSSLAEHVEATYKNYLNEGTKLNWGSKIHKVAAVLFLPPCFLFLRSGFAFVLSLSAVFCMDLSNSKLSCKHTQKNSSWMEVIMDKDRTAPGSTSYNVFSNLLLSTKYSNFDPAWLQPWHCSQVEFSTH